MSPMCLFVRSCRALRKTQTILGHFKYKRPILTQFTLTSHTVDSKTEDHISWYLSAVQQLVDQQFQGSERQLAKQTTLSTSTVNRTLNPESGYRAETRLRNLRQILNELGQSDTLADSDLPYQINSGSNGDQKEAVSLPRVSFKASAGDGSYVTEQEYEGTYIIDPSELKGVRPSELRDGMFVIEAEGDSMVPDIHPGEQLIIKPVEAPDRIASDAIYLFRLEKRVQIKRLQAFPGGRIRVKSKNTDYDDYELDLNAGHDFEILGLVWGRFERLA